MIPCEKCPFKENPNKNKHFCCGIVPFPIEFLEEHKPLFRANGKLETNGDTGIILTDDLLCVFYDRMKKNCAIYNERPKICQDYGLIEPLECPYFKKSGSRRTLASETQILRKITKYINKVAK